MLGRGLMEIRSPSVALSGSGDSPAHIRPADHHIAPVLCHIRLGDTSAEHPSQLERHTKEGRDGTEATATHDLRFQMLFLPPSLSKRLQETQRLSLLVQPVEAVSPLKVGRRARWCVVKKVEGGLIIVGVQLQEKQRLKR